MFILDNLSLSWGSKTLFANVSLSIKDGSRIGVVGDNGTGKTTLLNLLAGKQAPDSGTIHAGRGAKIGFLPQEMVELGEETIMTYLRKNIAQLEARIHSLEKRIATLLPEGEEGGALLKEYEELRTKHEFAAGYSFNARAKQLLCGLGFKESDAEKSCLAFSGGWKMRIALAGILLSNPSVMLLDEPTNHLDVAALEWLENYLKDCRATLIIVSHDKYFLDKTVDSIFELTAGKIFIHKGDYSHYLQGKEKRREALRKESALQKQELARAKEFIERFRYKATKAKQAQARLKAIAAIVPIEEEKEARAVTISFPPPPRVDKIVCTVKDLGKSYNGRTVFTHAHFSIVRGEKIAIVGANGEGKSTLVRLLAAVEKPSQGVIAYGEGIKIGFFSQESALEIRGEGTVWSAIAAVGKATDQQKRNLLGAFLFSGDDIQKKTAILSGGEKSRLALLKLLLTEANLLILDEPTNHLDKKTRDILLSALVEYQGTIVIVSHDRELLDLVTGKLFTVKNGRITEYAGNYSYFAEKQEEESGQMRKATKNNATPPSKNNKRIPQYSPEQLAFKLTQIENELIVQRAKKRQCEEELGNHNIMKDPLTARRVVDDYEKTKAEIARLSAMWEEVIVAEDKTL
ncbi:MAG: ATP-binding cassette domain-containing protein [Deltaproteobacteria bacterium]|nr:ATP-binding cassette domain-containing protein [Deltaproteobacteria bacterium]